MSLSSIAVVSFFAWAAAIAILWRKVSLEREARRVAEEQAAHVSSMLADIGEGFLVLNTEGAVVFANPIASEILKHTDSLLSQFLRDTTIAKSSTRHVHFHRPTSQWFELQAFPRTAGGAVVLTRDVTA